LATQRSQAEDVIRRLARVRRSTLAVGVLSALAAGAVVVCLAWVVVSALDMGIGLGGVALRAVALVMLALALSAVGYNLFRVLRVSHSIRSYAARVGRQLKDLGLDLVALLDLAELDNRKLGYSEALISQAMAGIRERVSRFDLEAGVRKRALVLYCLALALAAGGGLIWWRVEGASLSYSLARLGHFLGFSADSGIEIVVEPGDREILAGSDVEIRAEVRAFTRKTPSLHVLSGGEERAFGMEPADSGGARGRNRYGITLPKIDRDLTYFVAVGDETTRRYRVSVEEEPRITGGRITLRYPHHTGLASEVLPQGTWDIIAPFGTEAALDLVANCAPESAWISVIADGGETRDLPLRVAADSASAKLVLAGDVDYTIELAGPTGLRAKSHGPHAVTVIADKAPFVRIESPGREIMLEADMLIPLSVVALDDYGISMMKLCYEFKGGKGEIALAYRGSAQARCDYTWDVTGLDVFPGDAVSYYVVVADNDALTGPKYSRTDVYVARVPTVYELYQEIEERQDEDVESLEEVAETSENLKQDLEEIAEEMKKAPEQENALGWEQDQAIKQNLARQEDAARELDRISSSLDETLNLMDHNNVVSFEIIEKMEEIRQLLQEVANEDMMRALEKMREAMANLSPEEIRAAMENMSLSQEDLLKKLEQAIALLKRLRTEQRMDAAVNLAKQIAEGQKQADELLRDHETKDAGSREQGLASDTQQLKDMLGDLADMLRAEGNPVAEQVEQASEFIDAKKIQAAMQAMLSRMAQGNSSGALEQGESLEQDLDQLAGMLEAAGASLMDDEKKEIMAALKQAADGLRDVSGRQEEVLDALESSRTDVARSELARREIVYKEALDRIAGKMFDLSRKSMFVSPSLGRAVQKIGESCGIAARDLTEGTGRDAAREAKTSLGQINTLVSALMDAMDKASSCSSPGGLAEAFDSLENMCSMQMGINQGTQQMMGLGEQGLSMEARAQMARLAAEQEAVKRGLDDLAGQYGDRNEILGRLDDLAEEAKQIVEDLKGQRVSEETLQRQEKILTRMLDAQKSMRRREYSQRRKSRPGDVYQVASPPPLSLEEREAAVRDLLYRGRGYYPPEYEELIRAYFKAISLDKPSR
jgi:hypothetical protein